MVVGDDGTNGGLWCSPLAKTSNPTSSAFCAMVTIALIRWASVGVRPVVGSVVTSPTVKIPNCIAHSSMFSGGPVVERSTGSGYVNARPESSIPMHIPDLNQQVSPPAPRRGNPAERVRQTGMIKVLGHLWLRDDTNWPEVLIMMDPAGQAGTTRPS